MKAVAYKTPGPIDREDALQDITLETPKAGGLPLTTLTAWEMLFDRLDVKRPTPQGNAIKLVKWPLFSPHPPAPSPRGMRGNLCR